MYSNNNNNNNKIISNELWLNGPVPGQIYNLPGAYNTNPYNVKQNKEFTTPGLFGTQHTTNPVTTATTVVGLKFDNGVMIAADDLISYGSLARYRGVPRVFKLNEKTILGAGGDFADFQNIKRTIDQKIIEDMCYDDGIVIQPRSMYNWLTRILYNRRSNFNPLWLDIVVGGMQDGVPFLGHVDLRGRAYKDDVIATGFGKHIALPLIREQLNKEKPLTEEEASALLAKCMEVLYYRDCRAISTYNLAVCTKDGSEVGGPINIKENWNVADMVHGY